VAVLVASPSIGFERLHGHTVTEAVALIVNAKVKWCALRCRGKRLIHARGVTLALHKLGLRHGATAAGSARHEAA
jgi:hypothetical protein